MAEIRYSEVIKKEGVAVGQPLSAEIQRTKPDGFEPQSVTLPGTASARPYSAVHDQPVQDGTTDVTLHQTSQWSAAAAEKRIQRVEELASNIDARVQEAIERQGISAMKHKLNQQDAAIVSIGKMKLLNCAAQLARLAAHRDADTSNKTAAQGSAAWNRLPRDFVRECALSTTQRLTEGDFRQSANRVIDIRNKTIHPPYNQLKQEVRECVELIENHSRLRRECPDAVNVLEAHPRIFQFVEG